MKLFSLALLLLMAFSSRATDTYPKNPDIDMLHYAFSITLSEDTDEITSVARIQVKFKKEGIAKARLDLINKSEALKQKGMVVTSVMANGKALKYQHEKDVLWITLDTPTTAGEVRVLEVSYHGIPATGLLIGPNTNGDRTFFSDNWPTKARNWLPVVDHPYDKATCEFIVTAPLKYAVVSNGLKLEESNLTDGRKLTHWKESVPIAPWLYVLGVAEFAMEEVDTFDNKSIQTWVFWQDRDAGFYDFAVPTKDVLEFYTDYVGPFAYEKLANIQSNSVSGGMEAATAILYSSGSVTGQRTDRWQKVIIHEVAHQWFGNAVTEYDWDDVWLSEGFATYFTMLYMEHAMGRDMFVKELNRSRDKIMEFNKANPDYTIVHNNLDDMSKVTTGQIYEKGAWTLHMLRNLIGDAAFEKGIRSYYARYFNSNALTAEFITEMELASGKELDSFFNQWLHQGGAIELEGTWQYDAKAKKVVVDLQQVQKKYAFTATLEIGIYDKGSLLPRVERVELKSGTNQYSFTVASEPERVVLDPNTTLLASWKFAKK